MYSFNSDLENIVIANIGSVIEDGCSTRSVTNLSHQLHGFVNNHNLFLSILALVFPVDS